MADRLVTKSNVSVTFVWVKTTVDRDVWVIQFRDGAGAVQHTSAKADSLDDAKEFHSRSAKKKVGHTGQTRSGQSSNRS